MGETAIEWADYTFNPWWGCEKVSPGCQQCYAESWAKRTGFSIWGGAGTERRLFKDKHWQEPLKWDALAREDGRRHRVFCASMADIMEDRRDLDAQRSKLWNLIEATPHLDWLLLTKRPEHYARLLPAEWLKKTPDHIWLGCTAENQQQLDLRVPVLLRTGTALHWISAEPLIGPLDFEPGGYLWPLCLATKAEHERDHGAGMWCDERGLDWVIPGGESGPKARPCDIEWIRAVVAQCAEAAVPCFVKQLGSNPIMEPGPITVHLQDIKGKDIAEWPEDLQVREFPR